MEENKKEGKADKLWDKILDSKITPIVLIVLSAVFWVLFGVAVAQTNSLSYLSDEYDIWEMVYNIALYPAILLLIGAIIIIVYKVVSKKTDKKINELDAGIDVTALVEDLETPAKVTVKCERAGMDMALVMNVYLNSTGDSGLPVIQLSRDETLSFETKFSTSVVRFLALRGVVSKVFQTTLHLTGGENVLIRVNCKGLIGVEVA